MGTMASCFIDRTSCLPALDFVTAMRSYLEPFWNRRCNSQRLRLAAKPRGEKNPEYHERDALQRRDRMQRG